LIDTYRIPLYLLLCGAEATFWTDTPMEKDEIKDYLEQVMVEVQKSRRIPGTCKV